MKRFKTHRKDGSFRAGNKAHSLPPAERRVVLPAQRVAPDTLAKLKDYGKDMGGIGRVIDTAIMSMEARMRQLGSAIDGKRRGSQNNKVSNPGEP